ncbi:MAG: hypothetical protein JRJ31_20605 [Deltaproteobacteria bacterium]|nr:hypothetical protein [Deltaproteobacteria bacterium]
MDFLKAIFWDYPEFANAETVRKIVELGWEDSGYRWMLRRFLEYGRAVDTMSFFSIEEISRAVQSLRLTPYTKKKWRRLIEIYRPADRR